VALSLPLTGCDSPQRIVTRGGTGSYQAALAISSTGLIAGWYDERDGNAEIYMRQLDVNGRPADVERRLTTDPEQSYEPTLDAAGGNVAVAWHGQDPDGTFTARLGTWTLHGRRVWVDTMGAGSRNPVVRVRNDRLFCAWIEVDPSGREAVWGAWWHLDGHRLGPRRRLAPAGPTTWSLNVAVDAGGDAWVVFDARLANWREELYLAKLGPHAQSAIRLTADDGHPSRYPDIAVDQQRIAITWLDERDGNPEVYMAIADTADVSRAPTLQPLRVTVTARDSDGASLAWNRDVLGLVWSDSSDGHHDVFVQSFNGRGQPLMKRRRVATMRAAALIPAIRGWRRGFALAWSEYPGPRADETAGRRRRSEIAVAMVP
jgi:hypothetical protein